MYRALGKRVLHYRKTKSALEMILTRLHYYNVRLYIINAYFNFQTKRQKQTGRSNARQADDTEQSNHEHILDDEELHVYNPEDSDKTQVWVERFTTVSNTRFLVPLPPPDVDTTLYEIFILLELIKNGTHYEQVISLLNTGACVKPNPEKAGNGAKPIP
jgi:hypothetical protein